MTLNSSQRGADPTSVHHQRSVADEIDGNDVDVTVDIPSIEEPGVLALTVASDATTLSENGSTDLVRQFTGTLPTVTVTDTRTPDDVPDSAYWYVLGTASDFVSDAQPTQTIAADNFGWEPALVAGSGESFVSVGDEVGTALDGEPGLVDQELLFLADSQPATGGAWSATADLRLKVPASVAPGTYKSTITLSLFE